MQNAIDKFFRAFFWAMVLTTAVGICGIAGRAIAHRMLRDTQAKINEISVLWD